MFLSFLCFLKGDCQGHRPSVSHLSLKSKTSYMTCHSSACSAAARNPREITISLAFVCREPSCIKKHNSPLRFLQRYCTIHLYSEKDFRLVTFSHPSSQLSIYDASFYFLITSLQSSSIYVGLKSVLSCQSIRNEGERQSKSVGVTNFMVYHCIVYNTMHVNCFYSCHNVTLSNHLEVHKVVKVPHPSTMA